jgi:hypothetical protein
MEDSEMWRFTADEGNGAGNQGLGEGEIFFLVTDMNEYSFIMAH